MGAPNRMVRVNELVKRELAGLLERESWADYWFPF